MIGILLKDASYEQDIRELLMAFYPGETFAHERTEEVALYVEGEFEPEGRAEPRIKRRIKRKEAAARTAAYFLCGFWKMEKRWQKNGSRSSTENGWKPRRPSSGSFTKCFPPIRESAFPGGR